MYDVNYFIQKFEAIPEEMWCIGAFVSDGRKCAYGHCGFLRSETLESYMLMMVFCNVPHNVIRVNDGEDLAYKQPTPKQRILAALYDIKASEAVKKHRKF